MHQRLLKKPALLLLATSAACGADDREVTALEQTNDSVMVGAVRRCSAPST
jgi:hypothetical protein